MLINEEGLTKLQCGRLYKILEKVYNFNGEYLSLGDYLRANTDRITHKTKTTRTKTTHRVNFEYKTLAHPITEYTVWMGKHGIDIPKMVWDALRVNER